MYFCWIYIFPLIFPTCIWADYKESFDEDYSFAYFNCEDKGADFLVQHTTHICYTIHNGGKKSWEDARVFCETIGGKLLKMTDLGFGDVVFSGVLDEEYEGLIKPDDYNKFWLAAKDDDSGTFRWTDGTIVPDNLWHTPSNLASLAKGWFLSRKLCVSLQENGLEKDECTEKLGYICDHGTTTFPQKVKPEVETTEESHFSESCQHGIDKAKYEAEMTMVYEDKCYALFSKRALPFKDGRKLCQAIDGDLAKITSPQMSDAITVKLRTKATFFIGAIDKNDTKEWKWIDGSQVSWGNWSNSSTKELETKNESRCVLVVKLNGGLPWQDVPCDAFAGYLCEYDPVFPSTENSNLQLLTSTMAGMTSSPKGSAILSTESILKGNKPLSKETAVATQKTFQSQKIVGGNYNPKLKEKPDEEEYVTTIEECLRACNIRERCSLVNYFQSGHCAIYWDAAAALLEGSDDVKGWVVWKAERE